METNETNPGKRPSWPLIAGFVVVIALILIGLFLPPISLGTRLGLGGDTTEETTTQPTQAPQATAAATLPEGVSLTTAGGSVVGVTRVAAAELATAANGALAAAAAALPAGAAVGDAYVLDYSGDAPTGQVALPLPADVVEVKTVDLYGWDGQAWTHVPSQIDANARQAVAAEGTLPRALVLVRTAAPEQPVISADLQPDAELPADVSPLLA